MKLSKRTWFILWVVVLAGCVLIGGMVRSFYSGLVEMIRYDKIVGISTALRVYTQDYETLPEMDKWCDLLIEKTDCSPLMFEGVHHSEKGVCGYALNKALAGLKFSELDDKVVLAFEAKGPWNLSGGPELVRHSTQERIAVVFVGGTMDFVPVEEIDRLKWTP